MVLLQFLAQDIHFAVALFMALATFAVFWLIFDAWTERKNWKEFLKWVGFLLLSLAFLLYAAVINQASFGRVAWGMHLSFASQLLRLLGYITIISGQLLDPLQPVPKVTGLDLPTAPSPNPTKAAGVGLGLGVASWQIVVPIASLGVALLYLRRARQGLERHLQPMAISLMWLAGFEIFSLTSALNSHTSNPILYKWVAPFGYFWMITHVCLVIGAMLLSRWVWKYLVKRLQSQLFIIFTTMTTIIFLVSTISFTYLLMSNVQQSSLKNLKTANVVLSQSLKSKSAETLADAEVLSENPAIITAVQANSHQALAKLAGNYLVQKNLTSFTITNANGEVLLRGENPDLWGQSISSEALFQRAQLGESDSGVIVQQGVLAPTVGIEASAPMYSNGHVVGVVIAEKALDNAFLDGVKRASGLDSAIFAGSVASSSTFIAPDGTSRWVGVRETNQQVKHQVLSQGDTFSGELSILNSPYLAVYTPLKDVDNVTIGMLLTAQAEPVFLHTVARSVELTFAISVGLITLMVIPAYVLARRIAAQLQ